MYVGGKGGGDCVQNPRQMLRQLNLFFEYGIHPFMYTNAKKKSHSYILSLDIFGYALQDTTKGYIIYIEYRSQEMSSM